MQNGKRDGNWIWIVIGALLVGWLSVLLAPTIGGGLPVMLLKWKDAFLHPFHLSWCEKTLPCMALFLLIYALFAAAWCSVKPNYRRREEYGSAEWGDVRTIDRQYAQLPEASNRILTQHLRIGYDGYLHRRNLNTLVVGGSGSGKTRFYAKPNLMQANTSFVVLDPKGELIRSTGGLLEAAGYEVRVLDLIHMEKSHCYNPFYYLQDENDVQRLVTNLFASTAPKYKQGGDPFWDTAASMLLMSLILYLQKEAMPEEQNFAMVMELLRAGDVDETNDKVPSILDELFAELELHDPDHMALKYYRSYRSGAVKTLKSIQITLASRLEKFHLESMAALTHTDELDLGSLGERKVALFAIIPDNDKSFNFLVSILYTQLFQQLFRLADGRYGGKLPVHVHFLMDEFANIALPDDFDKILSVMRSREVSVSIILQNLAQLKALFEKQWESIVGNCDEFVYLGGNEASTHKYVSELIGKETIDTNTYGRSDGLRGNFSTNYQLAGRDLMSADEVRMLDNRMAIVFIRGEHPVIDEKYDICSHPNVGHTQDGGADAYLHGQHEADGISFVPVGVDSYSEQERKELPELEAYATSYEVYDEEEADEWLLDQYRKKEK